MQGAPQQKSSMTMWLVVGCGGLFVVTSCCGLAGAGYWFAAKQREDRAAVEIERRMAVEREEAARAEAEAESERASAEGHAADVLAAEPVHVTMTVTSADGVRHVSVGTTCEFDVGMHQLDQGPMCQAHVVCNGVRLYGDTDTNGYFPCTLTAGSVSGADTGTTSSDTDPAISIDTAAGTIAISDDRSGRLGAFHVTGTAYAGAIGIGHIGMGHGGS